MHKFPAVPSASAATTAKRLTNRICMSFPPSPDPSGDYESTPSGHLEGRSPGSGRGVDRNRRRNDSIGVIFEAIRRGICTIVLLRDVLNHGEFRVRVGAAPRGGGLHSVSRQGARQPEVDL